MVQGPQDLPELIKSAGALPPAPASAGTKQRISTPPSPAPGSTTLAPDTVQLSQAGRQAAARALELAKQADSAGSQLAHPAPEVPVAERLALAAPSVAPAVTGAFVPAPSPAPAGPEIQPAPRAQAVGLVLSPAQAQALQSAPEVSLDRVVQAQTNLSSLSGDSSALNAKLAEKLLTES